ncbi:hypothetical protein LTR37_007092 [Vermiconidia calcicola]|uniref:Uncharacterized protein n=1 Tax=Vermiconidia calcicola TaxID=1690605 RepID=A0ACC3NEP0_9PEZI|nr:hypothetical protein LTR37_007092 [Vermiconidia calcicola]
MPSPPFHRLLSFYSNRNPSDPTTIRLGDSLRGNLSLGLDFPVALAIAVGRHLFLRNTASWFSLNIHLPSVKTTKTLLDNVVIEDEKDYYTCAELVSEAGKRDGWAGRIDAVGLWALAADVKTGRVSGEDVVGFQRGELFERVEARRRSREQVLPFWRGGPISVTGHSWFVKKLFDVDVYRTDVKSD